MEDGSEILILKPQLSEVYFPNPGIGWQNSSETPTSMGVQESVLYPDRREIAWSILNPAEGIYDWAVLDERLQAAAAAGNQFSFRVYTMIGESFGGHMVPGWVLGKGATLLPETGEPDYSNCVYQEEWGRFVNELVRTYDGNPNIAFIDISGYGNFNEWSWQDSQTDWDSDWEAGYLNGSANSDLFETLDGQARRRLADMFIGGSFDHHECHLSNGDIRVSNYAYVGFQKTQLVMPYAGIVQATQYVFSRRKDVGFRYDCLGRNGERVMEKVGSIVSEIWMTAPVVFEFCKPDQFDLEDARALLAAGHGSIVHDNNWKFDSSLLKELIRDAGYRYFIKDATLQMNGQLIAIQMDWQNIGYAPSYPKMGQEFQMRFYLVDATGTPIHEEIIQADISQWLPAKSRIHEPQVYQISHVVHLPFLPAQGVYYAAISIVEVRTGKPINLAFEARDPSGWNLLAKLEVK
jgi:hypothetical protein